DAVALARVRAHLQVRHPVWQADGGQRRRSVLVAPRPGLEPERAHARATRARRELVARERLLEPELEQLVARGGEAEHVGDERREREGAALEPALLPVEEREVRGARRLWVL